MLESSALPAQEVVLNPENTYRYTPLRGLQGRLATPSNLNPDAPINLTKDSLGKGNEIVQKAIVAISKDERAAVKISYDQAKINTLAHIDANKKYFTEDAYGIKAAQFYKQLGGLNVDISAFAGTIDTFITRYGSNGGINEEIFRNDILTACTTDGRFDENKFVEMLPAVGWIANIFGKDTAETFTNNIHALKSAELHPDAFINSVQDHVAPDKLEPRSKELLTKLYKKTKPIGPEPTSLSSLANPPPEPGTPAPGPHIEIDPAASNLDNSSRQPSPDLPPAQDPSPPHLPTARERLGQLAGKISEGAKELGKKVSKKGEVAREPTPAITSPPIEPQSPQPGRLRQTATRASENASRAIHQAGSSLHEAQARAGRAVQSAKEHLPQRQSPPREPARPTPQPDRLDRIINAPSRIWKRVSDLANRLGQLARPEPLQPGEFTTLHPTEQAFKKLAHLKQPLQQEQDGTVGGYPIFEHNQRIPYEGYADRQPNGQSRYLLRQLHHEAIPIFQITETGERLEVRSDQGRVLSDRDLAYQINGNYYQLHQVDRRLQLDQITDSAALARINTNVQEYARQKAVQIERRRIRENPGFRMVTGGMRHEQQQIKGDPHSIGGDYYYSWLDEFESLPTETLQTLGKVHLVMDTATGAGYEPKTAAFAKRFLVRYYSNSYQGLPIQERAKQAFFDTTAEIGPIGTAATYAITQENTVYTGGVGNVGAIRCNQDGTDSRPIFDPELGVGKSNLSIKSTDPKTGKQEIIWNIDNSNIPIPQETKDMLLRAHKNKVHIDYKKYLQKYVPKHLNTQLGWTTPGRKDENITIGWTSPTDLIGHLKDHPQKFRQNQASIDGKRIVIYTDGIENEAASRVSQFLTDNRGQLHDDSTAIIIN